MTVPIRTRPKGLLGHTRALLKKIWPVYTLGDFKPAVQLQRSRQDDRVFVSEGTDPQFMLDRPVAAGWYMLEVQLRLPGTVAESRLYPDAGEGAAEATSMPMRIRTDQLSKRLVFLPQPARLRFDPMAAEGTFRVQRLRLAKVSTRFALQRMQRKLAARHPMHKNAGGRAQAAGKSTLEQWVDYCNLFNAGSELVSYADWMRHVELSQLPAPSLQAAQIQAWQDAPRFSIITPTWNTAPAMLRACLDSVLAQTYPHWEMCIADDASTDGQVRSILAEYVARDPRFKVTLRPSNGHIVEASNSALATATGDFVVLLDHDDTLVPHALFAVAKAIVARPSTQLLYSDEDKLDVSGKRCDPYFKPDFAPDLLYSQNYFSHLGVYRRELVQAVGGFRKGYEGSQDYDLVLRCVERVSDHADIIHISEVLYHWRMAEGSTAAGHSQKSYASDAGLRALQDHFDRQGKQVKVSVRAPGIYRHQWPLPAQLPLVSLIIPTRDGYDVLKTCIDSILTKTTYANYEIVVVDNQSTCPRTLDYLAALVKAGSIRVLRYDQPFNYSAINNFAVLQARGSILGLINNDIEVINSDWLEEMVSHAARPDIGCVGAKLYYPDGTIQHAGVVCGLGGIANHAHRLFPNDAPGYFGRLWVIHNLSAVTAAVLLVRKAVFEEVGGLDAEGLPVAFNDVDLCLKVRAAGYRNLWTPYAELYHHESVSRGSDDTPHKRARFESECKVMYARWAPQLANDPYYNPNLTRQREDFSLASGVIS